MCGQEVEIILTCECHAFFLGTIIPFIKIYIYSDDLNVLHDNYVSCLSYGVIPTVQHGEYVIFKTCDCAVKPQKSGVLYVGHRQTV